MMERIAAVTASAALVVAATLVLLAAPATTEAQSVLDRTPNLGGGWVGAPGTLQFNFLHRFNRVDTGDETTTLNSPTFLLAYPLTGRTLLGFQYASESFVVSGKENEWELFGRWLPLAFEEGSPVDLSLTGGYNTAASSFDGEVQVALPVGPLRLMGVGRVFSDQGGRDESGFAAGGGAVLRVSDNVAVAGDVISAFDRPDDRDVAWGAGLQLGVPTTPHTVSLQVTNTRTGTLLGSSEGFEDFPGDAGLTWGFEFTVPITLSRVFGGGGGSGGEGGAAGPGGAPGAGEAAATTVGMGALTFTPDRITVPAGTTVTWENTSTVAHTVTADPARAGQASSVSLPAGVEPFDSGNMPPGASFSYTFRTPGEYVYFCIPHEMAGMIATVVVTP